jgi:hypothetical protein
MSKRVVKLDRQIIGSLRPSRAVVIAFLALFLSTAGPVAAKVLLTSNSQIGENVVSGHEPPAGAHPNIIAGSVNATDLASAVQADLAGVPHAVNYNAEAVLPQTFDPIATAGDLTLEGSCPGIGGPNLWLYATTSAGARLDYSFVEAREQNDPNAEHDQLVRTGSVQLDAGRQRFLILTERTAGYYARLAGTFIFRLDGEVVQLDINTVENFGLGGVLGSRVDCTVVGTLTAGR